MAVRHDIILLTLAVYLGTVLTDLLKAVTKDILVPLTQPFVPADEFGRLRLSFFGYTLDFGDVFLHAVGMLVAIVLALLIAKFIRTYGMGWLKHFYE
jgi:large-conductance mechanosensitive channel